MNTTLIQTTHVVVTFTLKTRDMILSEGTKTFDTRAEFLTWVGTRAASEMEKGHDVLLKPGELRWKENDRTHIYRWPTGEGKTHQSIQLPKTNAVCPKCDGTGKWVGGYVKEVVRECFKCSGTGVIQGKSDYPMKRKEERKVSETKRSETQEECTIAGLTIPKEAPVLVCASLEDDENSPFTE